MTTPDGLPDAAGAALRRIRAGAREQDERSRTNGKTSPDQPNAPGVVTSRTRSPRRRGSGQLSGPGPDPRDPAPLGDLAQGLFRDNGWTQPLAAARLQALWPQIVGPTVAEHATPETFDPQTATLQVRTSSTAWAESLRLMLPDLRREIDAAVGQGVVRDIRIDGPVARTFRGRLRVRGRGPRDTYG
jgi:predicted nucleic acid-binding Zn ribbon protein